MIRLFGALMILGGCGAFGFSMAASYRRLESDLCALIRATEYMESELEFHQTPLPDLCRQSGAILNGNVSEFFSELGQELSTQQYHDASSCVASMLKQRNCFSQCITDCLSELGSTLGMFDITGQLQGLRSVRSKCQLHLNDFTLNKERRLRSYQTLGLCAGAALAIVLI